MSLSDGASRYQRTFHPNILPKHRNDNRLDNKDSRYLLL